jgi:tRNA A-37 threonylcarbamoyl transferase component Bud32
MNTEPITTRCPQCQAPLPANAPRGLCPKCLLAAVSAPTEAGVPADNNPPPSLAAVAAAFPQLEILEVIGQGGMGVVYKARQPRLDRLVALKLLPQTLAGDATFAERFNREARVLARLNHPNIVTVHDYGHSGGYFYLLMEYVDGVNLRQAMQAGRFTPQQAMMLVPKICEALQFAHDEGILHRDIKPANILLDTRGRVKIADFGIAKLVGEAAEKVTLTASGQAVGTPHYMAPEQLEHPQDVDQRADIYSLGVVFYEMLTGELPIGRFAPPSQKSAVDARVDDVVFHALEREREKRFRTATEVKTSVEAITGPSATPGAQPASAAARQQPTPAASAPPARVPCYFTTPARMRDCFPSAAVRVFTCQGELALDAECLTFIGTLRTTITVPLKDIEDLSVGQFQMWTTPWVMKYARISFLRVAFRQQGRLQAIHLTPVEAGAATAGEVNDCVGRWFGRIRQAACQATGSLPHASGPASVTVSAEPAWNRKALPLIFGCWLSGIATWFLQSPAVAGPIWAAALLVDAFLVTALLWFCVGFMRANSALWRGDLVAVTSDDPPVPEPWDAASARTGPGAGAGRFTASYVGVLAAALMAPLLLLLWGLGNSLFPALSGHAPRASAALAGFSTPQPEAKFVLYTLPSQVPAGDAAQPGRMDWTFKCLIPPQTMARFLFIRWTNGVPTVDNGVSTYFKVGKASVDADFWLMCRRLDEAESGGGKDNLQWNVNLGLRSTAARRLSEEPAYRKVEPPARLSVRYGHQAPLRLVDFIQRTSEVRPGQSGVELRIFIEPMNYLPVRTDPFEIEGTNCVAGSGPGWTAEAALQAIKQWPIDQ